MTYLTCTWEPCYEAALSLRHFTDQTLIQQQALELLRSAEGTSWVQGVQHAIVDEYQDTNPLQAALYRALAAAPPHNVCVVGDDDQALYRFRGGTVGCLVHFAEECQRAWPGCEVRQLSLAENYRSEPAIVEWCNVRSSTFCAGSAITTSMGVDSASGPTGFSWDTTSNT